MGRCIRLGKMHPNIVMSLSAIKMSYLSYFNNLESPQKCADMPMIETGFFGLFQGFVTFTAHKKIIQISNWEFEKAKCHPWNMLVCSLETTTPKKKHTQHFSGNLCNLRRFRPRKGLPWWCQFKNLPDIHLSLAQLFHWGGWLFQERLQGLFVRLQDGPAESTCLTDEKGEGSGVSQKTYFKIESKSECNIISWEFQLGCILFSKII